MRMGFGEMLSKFQFSLRAKQLSLPKHIVVASSLIAASSLLGSCGRDAGLNSGLPPVLDAAHVEQSSANIHRILGALQQDASWGLSNSPTWYQVMRAGFNYVDDQCTTYFNRLFKFKRRIEARKSGLNAFSATTNAILSATDSSTLSMAVVAQAFGLGTKLLEIRGNRFLFNLPPSETSKFVGEMQRAYREGAATQVSTINTPTEVYHRIQGYLELCLPPTIEARLITHVANAQAAPVNSPSRGEVGIVVGSPLTVSEQASLATVNFSNDRLRPLGDAPSVQGFKNSYEAQLTSTQIRELQTALCVKPDGIWGATTRAAVVEFFNGAQDPRPDIARKGITSNDHSRIRHAMQSSRVCKTSGAGGAHKSAFQLGKFIIGLP